MSSPLTLPPLPPDLGDNHKAEARGEKGGEVVVGLVASVLGCEVGNEVQGGKWGRGRTSRGSEVG